MLFDDLLFQTLHRVNSLTLGVLPCNNRGPWAVVCSQVAWFCTSMTWRWSVPHRYEPGFAQRAQPWPWQVAASAHLAIA